MVSTLWKNNFSSTFHSCCFYIYCLYWSSWFSDDDVIPSTIFFIWFKFLSIFLLKVSQQRHSLDKIIKLLISACNLKSSSICMLFVLNLCRNSVNEFLIKFKYLRDILVCCLYFTNFTSYVCLDNFFYQKINEKKKNYIFKLL